MRLRRCQHRERLHPKRQNWLLPASSPPVLTRAARMLRAGQLPKGLVQGTPISGHRGSYGGHPNTFSSRDLKVRGFQAESPVHRLSADAVLLETYVLYSFRLSRDSWCCTGTIQTPRKAPEPRSLLSRRVARRIVCPRLRDQAGVPCCSHPQGASPGIPLVPTTAGVT